MPSSALLLHLRTSTHDIHQGLHTHPFMVHHFLDDLDPLAYALFLSCFLPSWSQLGHHLPSQTLRLGEHSFSFESPLSDLSLDLEELSLCPPPRPPSPSKSPSGLWALGSLYTLIGSSLGAVVLLKHVQQHLHAPPTRYMSRAYTHHPWPKLTSFLHSLNLPSHDFPLVSQGALETFLTIQGHFDHAYEVMKDSKMHEYMNA